MYSRTDNNESNLLMTENNFTRNLDLKQNKECKNFCSFNNDCFTEYYVLKHKKEKYLGERDFKIFINRPFFLDLLIKHSPKIQIEEFLCFIASIIGLWFGFSIFMFTDIILLVMNFFIKKVNNYKINISLKTKKSINRINTNPITINRTYYRRKHKILF
jgi:hypothetical protein